MVLLSLTLLLIMTILTAVIAFYHKMLLFTGLSSFFPVLPKAGKKLCADA